jgi:hypothetical protein
MLTPHLWLRLVVAGGLAVDAYVHWHLAPGFDPIVGAGPHQLSQGQLFRLEAVLAAITMLLVLLVDHQGAAVLTFLVAAGGVAAVLLYRYVEVGALGPLPDMYDPTWYLEKTISVVAEGAAAVAALLLVLRRGSLPPGRRGSEPDPPAALMQGGWRNRSSGSH